MSTGPTLGRWFVAIALVLALTGCGAGQGTSGRDARGQAQGRGTADMAYTPPEKLRPPPEPAESPPLRGRPAGTVVGVGHEPEGLVADPETGLVAVGLRDPDALALVDGESGEVLREVKLPGSARHLGLAAPGGPVLVPAESSDSFVRVGLPDGDVLGETPVDNFPHNVTSAPDGRTFVISEAESTASLIEDGKVAEKIKTPLNPGGVAATQGGLVGIIGVRGLALEVFEADTLDSLGRVDAGEGPTHVVADGEGRFYVADTRGDAILVYEARPKLERVGRVSVPGGSPYGIAIDPRREHLWVTLTAENRLVGYDLGGEAPRKITSFPTVRQPNSVAVDPASERVFVAGREEGKLQILVPGSGG